MSVTFAVLFAPGNWRNASIFIAHVCACSPMASHAPAFWLFAFVFSFAPLRVSTRLRCNKSKNERLATASATASGSGVCMFGKIGVTYALRTSRSARSMCACSMCNETFNPFALYSVGVITFAFNCKTIGRRGQHVCGQPRAPVCLCLCGCFQYGRGIQVMDFAANVTLLLVVDNIVLRLRVGYGQRLFFVVPITVRDHANCKDTVLRV